MRDAEGRKEEASNAIQTTKQSNTAHPRQSLFQRKTELIRWDSNPQHSTCITNISYSYYEGIQYSYISTVV